MYTSQIRVALDKTTGISQRHNAAPATLPLLVSDALIYPLALGDGFLCVLEILFCVEGDTDGFPCDKQQLDPKSFSARRWSAVFRRRRNAATTTEECEV